ncbi:hypothetical protein [Nocardia cyriacigeorgica]|uniref:hypothetical protein n=1 Tax=Nocardia cyriacigeorgica TaxID=135487 RepID=UPI002455AD16|nr:hypothetical protein [Nocardia cyriacigeorgica]
MSPSSHSTPQACGNSGPRANPQSPKTLRFGIEADSVAGIACGDLPDAVFRSWLEQDYLYLVDYVPVFSRLAWQAPAARLGDLVDPAHSTYHEELSLHRTLPRRHAPRTRLPGRPGLSGRGALALRVGLIRSLSTLAHSCMPKGRYRMRYRPFASDQAPSRCLAR